MFRFLETPHDSYPTDALYQTQRLQMMLVYAHRVFWGLEVILSVFCQVSRSEVTFLEERRKLAE